MKKWVGYLFIATLTVQSAFAALPTSINLMDSSKWDSVFNNSSGNALSNGSQLFGVRHPELAAIGDESDRYAWNAHYWLRAYGLMAQVTGDSKYLDLGFELIDTMFYKTDRARYNRGEITIPTYDEAPMEIAKRQWCRSHTSDSHCIGRTASDSNAVGMGWRRLLSGKYREETLNDGQIAQGMLRFLALVTNDSRFSAYKTKALADVAKIERILLERLKSFDYNLYATVPGSFYYIRMTEPFADTLWGDPKYRFYSNPVPFNHSATMTAALLLLDSAKGTVTPEYRRMADSVAAYFKAHVRTVSTANGPAYEWDYELYDATSGQGVEDMGHGHVDMSFLAIAPLFGIKGITQEDMTYFTNSYRRTYQGNGVFFEEMDATGYMQQYDHFDMGYDWIDVMGYTQDSTMLGIARTTLYTQWNSCWSRTMLMWANIIRWQKYFDGTLVTPNPVAAKPALPKMNPVTNHDFQYRADGRRVANADAQGVFLQNGKLQVHLK